jgi:hypothetical protein
MPHGNINFSSPHGDNQFFFASRQESISFRLHGDSRHTALLIFSLPHSDNQFFFAPRKILLIIHQGFFYERHFFFSFASFLMLSIKASIHWRWCCFYCDAG